MKLYVAGPMRGKPEYNFPKFDEVCARLREMGHVPLGPQELDRMIGIDEKTLKDSDINLQMVRSFFHRDLGLILTEAEGIVCLPEWDTSSGAKAEIALGNVLRLPLFDEWMNPITVVLKGTQNG